MLVHTVTQNFIFMMFEHLFWKSFSPRKSSEQYKRDVSKM